MKAKQGDKVKVHYVGKHTNGEVFDSSVARSEPIEFELGKGQMIKGFEHAVLGMEINEKKTVLIPCEEAYGPIKEDHFVTFQKEQLPDGMKPNVGDQLMLTNDDGQKIPVTVTKTSEESITLDANHPMAGKDLTFEIQLMQVASA